MTRSIGDLVAGSVGVTSEPELQVFSNLTEQDRAIVIASDGIFDRFSNKEITKIVMSPTYAKTYNADGAINHLVNEAVKRWQKQQGMVDDITLIVAYLKIDPEKQIYKQGVQLD